MEVKWESVDNKKLKGKEDTGERARESQILAPGLNVRTQWPQRQ